jgi:hypothetical protein
MLKRLSIALIATLAASAAQAQNKSAEHPRFCVMNVGPTQMMFSAFQENRSDGIFCQHVPELGKTMIILDAKSNELRDMNIEVRILRNVGQQDWRDDLEATQVALLPPAKRLESRGTTSFTHDFTKDGDYIAVVRAYSDDGAKEYVGEYMFTVGDAYEQALMSGGIAALFACAAALAWRVKSSAKN